jgi:hypothetical protein
VDITVKKHQDAKVDKLGRGLKSYTSIDLSSWDDGESGEGKEQRKWAGMQGVEIAKYGVIANLNGDDMMVSYIIPYLLPILHILI